MVEKPRNNFKTPDLSNLQEVVIDNRTKIYITIGADPEEAKNKFLLKLNEKKRGIYVKESPKK